MPRSGRGDFLLDASLVLFSVGAPSPQVEGADGERSKRGNQPGDSAFVKPQGWRVHRHWPSRSSGPETRRSRLLAIPSTKAISPLGTRPDEIGRGDKTRRFTVSVSTTDSVTDKVAVLGRYISGSIAVHHLTLRPAQKVVRGTAGYFDAQNAGRYCRARER